MKLTTDIYLVLRLRKVAPKPLSLYMPLWCVQSKLRPYITNIVYYNEE